MSERGLEPLQGTDSDDHCITECKTEEGKVENVKQAMDEIASREKYWDELDDSEKIERMRGEVKKLQRSLASTHRRLSLVQRHSHDTSGGIVVPIETYDAYDATGMGGNVPRSDSGQVYF